MKPRHKAAENALLTPEHATRLAASMKPRHKAAENSEVVASLSKLTSGLQ